MLICTRFYLIFAITSLLLHATATNVTAKDDVPPPSIDKILADTSDAARSFNVDDMYRSRLLFSSTAVPIGKGELEVSVVAIGMPQVAVGVTPSLSVEAGLSVAPSWFGDVFLANPKLKVWSQGRWSLALDARTVLAQRKAGVFGRRDTLWEVGSVPQMIGTVTLQRGSITLGVGIPWNTMGVSLKDPRDAFGNEATMRFTAGADLHVKPWMKILTENYIYVGVASKEAINSAFQSTQREALVESMNGVRLHKAGVALDIAVGVDTKGVLLSNDLTEVFPYLRLSYRF